MIDLCIPEVLSAGISIHGTGFQSDLWLGNLAVVAFVAWAFRSGGKKALALALVPALAMVPEAHAAAYVERPFWDGMDITPVVIFAVLVWLVSGGKKEPKKKAAKPKSDPAADILAGILRSGKKVLPLALGIALSAAPLVHAFSLFESDGDRAIKRAEAERIQAENRMAERSHAYVLAEAKKPPKVVTRTVVKETGIPIWFGIGTIVIAVTVLGLLLIREEGRRQMAELELERYQVFYGRAHDLLSLEYRNRGGAETVDALLLEADTDGRA